ncbi:TPA: guanylate kinase [Candidatus Scatousia excrementigallinarum]|uniref:Guanylate kinase n=1 Tax=Candidatus Scatousia excrementigallinarum TaxID=2840935 RepID=A0A9D1F265_9BACT|nr:guanylate kinase [Candidatus Scatousia excrementigallinarum]
MNKNSGKKKLFVISGSSGVGKGTVLKSFLTKNPNFMLSISCTTRAPRKGEVDGVNYFFLSKDEFQNCIDNDKFLEWAEFAGNRYGTKKKYIKQCLEEGKDIILEIDTQGALQVKKQMPEAVLIFICPPSLETLENRLRGRHTEDEATIQKRMQEVKTELERAEKFDYKVINDDLANAVAELEKVIIGEQKC